VAARELLPSFLFPFSYAGRREGRMHHRTPRSTYMYSLVSYELDFPFKKLKAKEEIALLEGELALLPSLHVLRFEMLSFYPWSPSTSTSSLSY